VTIYICSEFLPQLHSNRLTSHTKASKTTTFSF